MAFFALQALVCVCLRELQDKIANAGLVKASSSQAPGQTDVYIHIYIYTHTRT